MIVQQSDTDVTDDDASNITSVDLNLLQNSNDLSSLLSSYFSSRSFSLPPMPSYDILTIACHNVRGLNDPVKQSQLLNFVVDKNISILGLSETKLSFSNSNHLYKDNPSSDLFGQLILHDKLQEELALLSNHPTHDIFRKYTNGMVESSLQIYTLIISN